MYHKGCKVNYIKIFGLNNHNQIILNHILALIKNKATIISTMISKQEKTRMSIFKFDILNRSEIKISTIN